MHTARKITDDLYYIGTNNRRLKLFENVFPVPQGASYNSYMLLDEKTALIDSMDSSGILEFVENIEYLLQDRPLDYMIINHIEPDHSAILGRLMIKYPDAKLVCTPKAGHIIKQFFNTQVLDRMIAIKDGDTLSTGKHNLSFHTAPMVHWPEVMVTFDSYDGTLFSADAFGTFGALSGSLYADEYKFECEWLPEARRYYTNIVGKYGAQVQALLKKASALEIKRICPLHGPIWRENIDWFIDKYDKWSSYTPEEQGVLIVFGSIYGNTEKMAEILAGKLADSGIKNIRMYDSSHTDVSVLVSEAFRYSHLIFLSATYNAGVFTPMANFVEELACHNFRNRTVAVIESGSWALSSGKLIRSALEVMNDMTILEPAISFKSAPDEEAMTQADELVSAIKQSLK